MRGKSDGRKTNIRDGLLPFCWLLKLWTFSIMLTIYSGFSFLEIFYLLIYFF